ncbi:MAG: energy-coupling factor transporter transmembrane component T [Candidatus Anstonellaceae archaeon]
MDFYSKKNSLFHLMDARYKLALLFLLVLLQIFLPLHYGAALFLSTILLYQISSVSILRLIRTHPYLLLLPLFTALVRLIIERGAVDFFGIAIPANLYFALHNFFFAFSIVFLPLIFALTTSPAQIASALQFFGLSRKLAFLFSLSFISIPFIMRKIRKTYIAQKCRGCSPFFILAIMLPVLHACFRKARRLSLSLSARGFDASSL